MRKTFWYILGGQIATMSIPALAQDPSADPAHDRDMMAEAPAQSATTDEAADYEAQMRDWPEDKRIAYEAWSADAKSYFWSLSEERREVFWRLNDADKANLLALDDAGREQAWTMFERRRAEDASKYTKEPEQPAQTPEPEGR